MRKWRNGYHETVKLLTSLEADHQATVDELERTIDLLQKRVDAVEAENEKNVRSGDTVVRSDNNTDTSAGVQVSLSDEPITIHSCVFCGWLGNDVRKHIQKCPKHPMRELEAENEKLEDRNIELLDKIVWLKAEIRRVTKADQIAECGKDKSPNERPVCTCGEINGRHCQVHQEPTELNGGAE